MKSKILIPFYLLMGTLLVTSCRYSKTPEVFTNKNVIIQYPSYLYKADDVYPEKNTLLQLKNDYRDVYFILLDHGMKPGDNGFEIMCDSIMNQLTRNLKQPNKEVEDTVFTTANNLKVKEYRISGILSSEKQDHRFEFLVDVFETPKGHIYQTAGWLLRHKRALWQNDLKTAARSLKVTE